jgi:hypothetical protein
MINSVSSNFCRPVNNTKNSQNPSFCALNKQPLINSLKQVESGNLGNKCDFEPLFIAFKDCLNTLINTADQVKELTIQFVRLKEGNKPAIAFSVENNKHLIFNPVIKSKDPFATKSGLLKNMLNMITDPKTQFESKLPELVKNIKPEAKVPDLVLREKEIGSMARNLKDAVNTANA